MTAEERSRSDPMKIKATAINGKPSVSLNVACGRLDFVADDLADSAILTAIYRAIRGQDKRLSDAIHNGAKRVARSWKDEPEFTMRPPRGTKAV
jgi:hypothetical protein